MRSTVDEVAVVLASSELHSFTPLINIPPWAHTHLSRPHEVCDSPDRAPNYHYHVPKVGLPFLSRHLDDLGAKSGLETVKIEKHYRTQRTPLKMQPNNKHALRYKNKIDIRSTPS
jgi:hypothetical protein